MIPLNGFLRFPGVTAGTVSAAPATSFSALDELA